MPVRLVVPSNLSIHCEGNRTLQIQAETVGRVLEQAISLYPMLGPHLWAADKTLHRYVNIFVNDQNIRDLNDLQTPVRTNDEVLIVPAIAGG